MTTASSIIANRILELSLEKGLLSNEKFFCSKNFFQRMSKSPKYLPLLYSLFDFIETVTSEEEVSEERFIFSRGKLLDSYNTLFAESKLEEDPNEEFSLLDSNKADIHYFVKRISEDFRHAQAFEMIGDLIWSIQFFIPQIGEICVWSASHQFESALYDGCAGLIIIDETGPVGSFNIIGKTNVEVVIFSEGSIRDVSLLKKGEAGRIRIEELPSPSSEASPSSESSPSLEGEQRLTITFHTPQGVFAYCFPEALSEGDVIEVMTGSVDIVRAYDK